MATIKVQETAPAPKRTRQTQQRTLDTRRKIIDAAIGEFAKNGYEGTSTRTVAEIAGVQHTLVTYHFQGKEGLWRASISDILQAYTATFNARLEGLWGVDDVTKLRLIQEDFVRFSATNLNFHRIMSHIASVPSQQLDWLIKEYLRRTFDGRAALIRSAQRAGCYVDGDPYHLEYLFLGAVTRVFMLNAEVEQIIGRSPFDPQFVEEHVRVCLGLFFRDPIKRSPSSRRKDRPSASGSAG